MTQNSTARIALVGDRSPSVRAHTRIPAIIESLTRHDGLVLDVYWIPTEAAEDHGAVDGFDGIWVTPGSPYRSMAGALTAIETARTKGIPFLGTCGGFQHAVLEFARNVCGLTGADHAEYDDPGDDLLIVALECSLAGHELSVNVAEGSRAEAIIGMRRTTERYNCSYGAAAGRLDLLSAHGLAASGIDDDGEVRIFELSDHPFFLATLFQPELAADSDQPHPVIRAFARAAVEQAGRRQS